MEETTVIPEKTPRKGRKFLKIFGIIILIIVLLAASSAMYFTGCFGEAECMATN